MTYFVFVNNSASFVQFSTSDSLPTIQPIIDPRPLSQYMDILLQ